MLSSRHAAAGAEIDFVAQKREVCSQTCLEIAVNQMNFADVATAKLRSNRRQSRVIQITRQPQRYDRHAAYTWKELSEIVSRSPQDFTVVNVGTEDNLRMNLDAGIEQLLHLRGNVRALLVDAKQVSTHAEIGCVYRNVLRR